MVSRFLLPVLAVLFLCSCMAPPKKQSPDQVSGDTRGLADNAALPDNASPSDSPAGSELPPIDNRGGDHGGPEDARQGEGPADDSLTADGEVGPCVPSCDGMQCGPDSCGGSCGTCQEGTKCLYGKCVTPSNQCLDPRADDPNDGCENGYVTDYQVNANNLGDQVDPVIVSPDGESGAFAIAWSDCPKGADTNGDGVREYPSCNVAFRAFNVNGAPTAKKDSVGTASTTDSEYRPGVTPLNGGFLLGWIDQTADGRRARARMWAMDSDAASGYQPYPEWDDILVGGTSEVEAESLVALSSSDSALDSVVVWAGETAQGKLGIVGRRIVCPDYGEFEMPQDVFPIAEGSDCLGIVRRLDGDPVTEFQSKWTELFQLAQDTSGPQTMPSGVAVDYGNILVTAFLGTEESGILVRTFELLDVGVQPEVSIYSNPAYSMSMPRIAALPGSRFVVVWKIENTPEDQAGGIYMMLLNADLTTLPGPVHVNGYAFDRQSAPQVASVGNDEFIVVWESCMGQDGDGCGIFARRFDANGKVLPLVKP